MLQLVAASTDAVSSQKIVGRDNAGLEAMLRAAAFHEAVPQPKYWL